MALDGPKRRAQRQMSAGAFAFGTSAVGAGVGGAVGSDVGMYSVGSTVGMYSVGSAVGMYSVGNAVGMYSVGSAVGAYGVSLTSVRTTCAEGRQRRVKKAHLPSF